MSGLADALLLDKDLLVAYFSQSSSLRAEGEEDRVTWWGSVFRKADRTHNSHSGPCSNVSSSSYISGNSYLSMNSQYVLPNVGSRTRNSHTVHIFPWTVPFKHRVSAKYHHTCPTRGELAVGWFYVEIKGLLSCELFLISVFFDYFPCESTSSAAEYFQPISFLNSLGRKLCNIAFPLPSF